MESPRKNRQLSSNRISERPFFVMTLSGILFSPPPVQLTKKSKMISTREPERKSPFCIQFSLKVHIITRLFLQAKYLPVIMLL